MQRAFIENWNKAIGLVGKKDPSLNELLLNPKGNCNGFSYAFLSYASRGDLDQFFDFVNFVAKVRPTKLARFLENKSHKVNELFKFVAMVAHLQKNQSNSTPLENGLTALSNVSRINVDHTGDFAVELLYDQISAKDLLGQLGVGEGLILGSEAHAYGVYKEKDHFVLFDSNDPPKKSPKKFVNIDQAARKLINIVDNNSIEFALSNIKSTRELFRSVVMIFKQFINLFRFNRKLSSPTTIKYGIFDLNLKKERSREENYRKSYSKELARLTSKGSAEALAMQAIQVNNSKLLKVLIAQKKLSVNSSWQFYHGQGSVKSQPIAQAIEANSIESLQALVESGGDINAPAENGNNAITFAVFLGRSAMVEYLLDHNADPNSKDTMGVPILSIACFKNEIEIVQILLAKHAKLSEPDKSGATPIQYALKHKNYEIVEILLQKGVDPNILSHDLSSLEFAIKSKDYPALELFLKYSANIKGPNENSINPLIFAIEKGDHKSVEILLNYNAQPNFFFKDVVSPLAYAIRKNDVAMVIILMNHGADPNLADKKGRTAYTYAGSNVEMLDVLDRYKGPASENNL